MPSKCKERERIASSTLVGVPSIPLAAIHGHLCFRCFSAAARLYKCLGCRRVVYCSKDCQRLDWVISHKDQCKTLREINNLDLAECKDSRTWQGYQGSLLRFMRRTQALSKHRETSWIIQAQPYCVSCRRSGNQLAHRNLSLSACEKCNLLISCNGCEATHPPSACAVHVTHSAIEEFRISLFEDVGDTSVVACTAQPRAVYKPLRDCKGWHDYFVKLSDKDMIKNSIRSDFSGLQGSSTPETIPSPDFETQRYHFLLLATDNLTMPLTIVSGLEDIGWTSRTSLNIHLLGATGREFLAINCFEEILHLLPTLKDLRITAIGPSAWLQNGVTGGYQDLNTVSCCHTCMTLGRSRTFASYKGLYHDFAATQFYQKPDLIVAFNSGWADGDDSDSDWPLTIRSIMDQGIPALFTTYNFEEAQHEKSVLEISNTVFVTEPSENPWRGLVPTPEFVDTEFSAWYQNYYIYIIQGII